MAIRHLTAAAVAATLSLSLVACGGSAEPEAASAPASTPTPTPIAQDWDDDFDWRWSQIDNETRDTVCNLTSGSLAQFQADWGVDEEWPEARIAAWYENARATDYCQQSGQRVWESMSKDDREWLCWMTDDGSEPDYEYHYEWSESDVDAAAEYGNSGNRCARLLTAKEEREAKQERQDERQRKIDAVGDTSLTDDQAVAVYDAVCEYLTAPGAEGDIIALGEAGINALPPGSTPQQQWDASVAAGYMLGIGACR